MRSKELILITQKKNLILRIDKKKKKDFKWIDVVKLQMSWKFTFWNIVGLVNDIETVNFMVLVNQNPINLIELVVISRDK